MSIWSIYLAKLSTSSLSKIECELSAGVINNDYDILKIGSYYGVSQEKIREQGHII